MTLKFLTKFYENKNRLVVEDWQILENEFEIVISISSNQLENPDQNLYK